MRKTISILGFYDHIPKLVPLFGHYVFMKSRFLLIYGHSAFLLFIVIE